MQTLSITSLYVLASAPMLVVAALFWSKSGALNLILKIAFAVVAFFGAVAVAKLF